MNAMSVRVSATVFALVLLLSSCAGDGSELDSTGVPLDPPEIAVDRSSIELSLVEGTSDTSSFVITNVGGFPLEIESVVAPETFLHPLFDGPVTVERNEEEEIRFLVDAPAIGGAPYTGSVQVSSNADLVPNLSVAVSLTITPAPEPEISVLPDTLRSLVVEGQIDTVTFTIANSGTADLVVSQITSSFLEAVPLRRTVTIQPSHSAVIPVQIDATQLEPGLFPGTLEIHSNDSDEAIFQLALDVTVDFSGPFAATLTGIQASVFNGSCSLAGCHFEAFPPLNLHLSPGESWENLVDVPSFFDPSLMLVKPFDPENSFLIIKLVELDERRIGERMPIADLPYLDESAIDVIRRWIDDGAPNN